ncbi:MAG: efflux RND transporter periplasmic adaptor subunit [Akkermansiaceae bacterium]|nr:efflux RND transporter periplasmic adaptor subunit [Akkermansiaceae bacterium]
MKASSWIISLVLIGALGATAAGLAAWKRADIRKSMAEAAAMPEPAESIVTVPAGEVEHRNATVAVGTVLALRSITLRNEMAGTVVKAHLTPGKIVEEGALLVALDISVEEAELRAQEAQVALAETTLKRMQRLSSEDAAPVVDLDRAQAERDIALAQAARTKAVMVRKTITAPFRARIGISDVHPGQYLEEGSQLTTLQGVDEAVHVDFTVTQVVAAGLQEGNVVEILSGGDRPPLLAKIVALDARVDPRNRSSVIRARIDDAKQAPTPGASVRVRVPVGESRKVVTVPVSALRRGPEGDHVFVIGNDPQGKPRSQQRLVKSGAMNGDMVVIESGLKPGEVVATAGSFKLREGALVAVAAAPKSAAAGQAN